MAEFQRKTNNLDSFRKLYSGSFAFTKDGLHFLQGYGFEESGGSGKMSLVFHPKNDSLNRDSSVPPLTTEVLENKLGMSATISFIYEEATKPVISRVIITHPGEEPEMYSTWIEIES